MEEILLVLMETLVHQKKKFSTNFCKANTKFYLGLHYNTDNNLLMEKKSFNLMLTINIRINDRTRFLTLFGSKTFDAIYNRFRYLISLKSGITYIFSYYFAKIKVDSYDTLLIEIRLTFHNVIINIKSVLTKDKNHYYYNIFLEKWSYQLVKK